MIEDATKITPEEASKLSEKELLELDDRLDNMASEIDSTWDFTRPFTEYQHAYRHIDNAAGIISRELNLKKTPSMEPHDDIGDLFTFEDFKSNCESGGFIDYDGFGYYATATEQSDIEIRPSHLKRNKYRNEFTHVMWYNR